MKSKFKMILLALIFGVFMVQFSCGSDDDDCPDKTYNSLAECEDAVDGKKCICVKEGSGWKAILNP